jgi:hypothetical protein
VPQVQRIPCGVAFHDPSASSESGENATPTSKPDSAMRWASASTLEGRTFRALASLDPVRDICGISGVESRFNEPIDSGLGP